MATDTQPTDHFVEVNGLNYHYVDWGGSSNRVLLFAHGQGGNSRNWDHIARELRDEFRVIAVDQRGHGDTDHTREGYSVKLFAEDLAEFAEIVGIAPYDYCGASLGARNGIPYAGDHSEHLKHFVCLDYGPEIESSIGPEPDKRHERPPAGLAQLRRVQGERHGPEPQGSRRALAEHVRARLQAELRREVRAQAGPGDVLDQRQLRRQGGALPVGPVGQDSLSHTRNEGRRRATSFRPRFSTA